MKKNVIRVSCLIIYILVGMALIGLISPAAAADVVLQVELEADYAMDFQVYYSETLDFAEELSQSVRYTNINESDSMKVAIPNNANYIRLDFGTQTGNIQIRNACFTVGSERIVLQLSAVDEQMISDMVDIEKCDESLAGTSSGEDPHIIVPLKRSQLTQLAEHAIAKDFNMRRICMGAAILFIGTMFFIRRKKIYAMWLKLFHSMSLVTDLAKNDFKTRFAGSYLGIVWAFVQPVVTILVYWFVFQVGFRSGEKGEVPFVLWLASGLIPWFFFNEALNSATNCLMDYSYLVKKVVFDIQIIPIVRVLSALFVHMFFVLLILIMFLLGGVKPNLTWIQLPYYSLCLMLFVLGLSYATSALIVFFRDLGQIILVVLQVGIWITPIMWDWEIMPAKLQWLFKINPMYYIVQGYRDALINHTWFWDNTYMTVYFWMILLFVTAAGITVFNRLRIHFADVL